MPPLEPDRLRTDAVRDFHDRMRAVGQLIRDGFGLGDDLDASRVNHDACRLVMSLIIETLVTADRRLPTAELGAVSRIIAEQRKLDTDHPRPRHKRDGKMPIGDTLEADDAGTLPGAFHRIVDRIYGTNLAARDNPDADTP